MATKTKTKKNLPVTVGDKAPAVVAPPLTASEARTACVAALFEEKMAPVERARERVKAADAASREFLERENVVKACREIVEGLGYGDKAEMELRVSKTWKGEAYRVHIEAVHDRAKEVDCRIEVLAGDMGWGREVKRLVEGMEAAHKELDEERGKVRAWAGRVLGKNTYSVRMPEDLQRACRKAVAGAVKEKTVDVRVKEALETEEGRAWALDTLKVLGLS